jgi:putative transposase
VHRRTFKRFNDEGDAHALTFSCFHRRPFLNRDRSRTWFLEALDRARNLHPVHLWAYVVMPEHAHVVLWPTEPEFDVGKVLASVKKSVANKAIAHVRRHAPRFLKWMEDVQPNGDRHHRFWQRGSGYDRNLREPRTVWAEIDYVHANPVRRERCERPIDWPWSSAAEYDAPGTGPLSLDLGSLPRTPEG